MSPRNAILFLIIFVVIVGGGVAFLLIGKQAPEPDLTSGLPPAAVPATTNDSTSSSTDQPPKESGSWLSKLFSFPSFDSLAIKGPALPELSDSGNSSSGSGSGDSSGQALPEASSNFSPFRGKIHLNRPYTYDYGQNSANYEYVTLQTDSSVKTKIRLTGMVLRSAINATRIELGQAAPLYFSGQINTTQDIYLGPNETVYVVTGRSPFGVSFQVNKCLGYLSRNQTFNPGLSTNCPLVRNEPLPPPPNSLNDKCLDYIDSFPSCTTFSTGELGLSPECNNYLLEKTTYGYCVQNHKNETDFYQKDWRVYLSRSDTIWKSKRETVELLDQNGKLIDSVSY